MKLLTTTSTLLLGSLVLSSGLFAQNIDPATNNPDLAGFCAGAADACAGAADAFETGKRIDTQTLRFQIDGHAFNVSNGRPGDLVGIFVGFERISLRLPGGAELRVNPLVMLGSGRLNTDGEFSTIVGYDGKMLVRGNYYLQAISVREEDGLFAASNVRVLNFFPDKRALHEGEYTNGKTDADMTPDVEKRALHEGEYTNGKTDAEMTTDVQKRAMHDGEYPNGKTDADMTPDAQKRAMHDGEYSGGKSDADSLRIPH